MLFLLGSLSGLVIRVIGDRLRGEKLISYLQEHIEMRLGVSKAGSL